MSIVCSSTVTSKPCMNRQIAPWAKVIMIFVISVSDLTRKSGSHLEVDCITLKVSLLVIVSMYKWKLEPRKPNRNRTELFDFRFRFGSVRFGSVIPWSGSSVRFGFRMPFLRLLTPLGWFHKTHTVYAEIIRHLVSASVRTFLPNRRVRVTRRARAAWCKNAQLQTAQSRKRQRQFSHEKFNSLIILSDRRVRSRRSAN